MNYLIPIVTAIIGAVAGYFLSLNKDIIIMKRQEVAKAKDNIIIGINEFIISIRYNDFGNNYIPLKNLIDYLPIIEKLLNANIIYLKNSVSVDIMGAYENYHYPNIPDGFPIDHPFKIYGIDEKTSKNIPNFPYSDGKDFAIKNLQKIIDVIN